jgi:fructose-bisphosphate aldolase, class I
MDKTQLNRIEHDKGFFAALDQSGGSTPQVLSIYGISEDSYQGEARMYELRHEMCSRMITSPAFSSEYILAVILFKETMRRQIEDMPTVDYLWEKKRIVSFLKVDSGLADYADGVQTMKPVLDLADLLMEAKAAHVFGTKMRSVIKENNPLGIKKVIDQQFEMAKTIIEAGLLPIVEPEVDINASDKANIETILREQLLSALDSLPQDYRVVLKLTLPEQDNLYSVFTSHPKVVRVLALSGGYGRDKANEKLARNNGVIASFNRALSEGLLVSQTDEEFNQTLADSVVASFQASIS